MKKLLFAVTLAGLMGLGASASEVTSANTFGVLKVESSTAETIICVPWVKVGTGDAISVADLVMTSNLTKGDTLYYYNKDTDNYKAWVLGDNGWGTPTMVTGINKTDSGTSAATQTAVRGDALILVRQNPTENNVAKPIYLYGQYTSDTFTGQEMTPGAWNLIAYPNTSGAALDLNTGLTWSNVNEGDKILLQNANGYAITFSWHDEKWARKIPGEWSSEGAVIQPGMGAWYKSAAPVTDENGPSYAVK